MTEAAERIGLSQPAISAHLKTFENHFPISVFAQHGRRKTLTPFGLALSELFQKRFTNLESEIQAQFNRFVSPAQVTVHIAGRHEILLSFARQIEFPGTLVFHPGSSEASFAGVEERRFDLAIARTRPESSELHTRKLFSDRFVALIPSEWSARRTGALSSAVLTTLREKPFLAYEMNPPNLESVKRHFDISDDFRIATVFPDWPTLIAKVENGHGWTLAPNRFNYSKNAVTALSLPEELVRDSVYHLAYRRESLRFEWFKSLLNRIAELDHR
jgi:DNA-binding transcriptional LysR family regulator